MTMLDRSGGCWIEFELSTLLYGLHLLHVHSSLQSGWKGKSLLPVFTCHQWPREVSMMGSSVPQQHSVHVHPPPDKLPMGKSQISSGEWKLETGRDTGITGNWRRRCDSFLEHSQLSESSTRTDQPTSPLRLATPATTPVLDPSVLAEMGDTCTNGTHPPAIQALSPSFMSCLLQTTASRVWPSPTHVLDQEE